MTVNYYILAFYMPKDCENCVKEYSKEELMGAGMIACSVGIIVFGLLSLLSEMLDKEELLAIGSYTVIVGLAIGVAVMTFATIKYNKGIV